MGAGKDAVALILGIGMLLFMYIATTQGLSLVQQYSVASVPGGVGVFAFGQSVLNVITIAWDSLAIILIGFPSLKFIRRTLVRRGGEQ